MDFMGIFKTCACKYTNACTVKGEGGALQRHRSLTPVQKLDGNGPEESETTNYSSTPWPSP